MSIYGSDLQLNGIRVEKLIFNVNNNYEDLTNIDKVDISIVPTPKINRENLSHGMLELEVTLFDEDFIEKNDPLFLKLKIVGIFVDIQATTESNVFDKYLPNAISMLYSYARAHIASLTGMFGIDVIQIPTVNILKLLDENLTESEK
ncbi:hypothetical protein MX075_05470 [Streptococcus uberis]|nr:hypothetical protein [Streptococcus uberis]MCK1257295.1 hypothetical protein [Streptococcus uberis]MCK1258976.1 hypothetical protein [Streptococcus uberis]